MERGGSISPQRKEKRGAYTVAVTERGFSGGSVVKNLPSNAGDTGDEDLISGRKWQTIPVFLSRKFRGQRNLVGSQRVGHD